MVSRCRFQISHNFHTKMFCRDSVTDSFQAFHWISLQRFEEKEAIRLAAMKNGEISKHFQIGDGDRRLFGNVLAKPLVVPSPECSMATVADTCSSCIQLSAMLDMMMTRSFKNLIFKTGTLLGFKCFDQQICNCL